MNQLPIAADEGVPVEQGFRQVGTHDLGRVPGVVDGENLTVSTGSPALGAAAQDGTKDS
jgi:hypothetical protein